MKILIEITKSPKQLFLVDLQDKSLIKEIARLISKKQHSKAIVEALSRGKFERELKPDELPSIKADFILTERNSHWDLTK